jgi:hypothetical protein
VAGSWTLVSVVGTAPDDAVFTTLTFYGGGAIDTAGATIDVTMAMVELGSSLGSFFDGSSVPTVPGYSNAWTGTARNSASVQTQRGYPMMVGLGATSGDSLLQVRRSPPLYQWDGEQWRPLVVWRYTATGWVSTTVTLY